MANYPPIFRAVEDCSYGKSMFLLDCGGAQPAEACSWRSIILHNYVVEGQILAHSRLCDRFPFFFFSARLIDPSRPRYLESPVS